jgi:hypothetical protein
MAHGDDDIAPLAAGIRIRMGFAYRRERVHPVDYRPAPSFPDPIPDLPQFPELPLHFANGILPTVSKMISYASFARVKSSLR